MSLFKSSVSSPIPKRSVAVRNSALLNFLRPFVSSFFGASACSSIVCSFFGASSCSSIVCSSKAAITLLKNHLLSFLLSPFQFIDSFQFINFIVYKFVLLTGILNHTCTNFALTVDGTQTIVFCEEYFVWCCKVY